jgi:hypothetical protein
MRLRGEIRAKILILLDVDCKILIPVRSRNSVCEADPDLCLLLSIFLVYQVRPFHYAKLVELSCQWNEDVTKYFWLGLLTDFGVALASVPSAAEAAMISEGLWHG